VLVDNVLVDSCKLNMYIHVVSHVLCFLNLVVFRISIFVSVSYLYRCPYPNNVTSEPHIKDGRMSKKMKNWCTKSPLHCWCRYYNTFRM